MSDLGSDIVGSFIQHSFRLVKDLFEHQSVTKMSPAKLEEWRSAEKERIHREAIRIAGHTSDRELAKRGETRSDLVRGYEVLMRGRRGIEMGQCLLDGMDVKGLDMSRYKPGHISQGHMNQADGDRRTKLPPDLVVPPGWRNR